MGANPAQGITSNTNEKHAKMDLSNLLSRSANEVTAPKLAPPGIYLFRVMGVDASKKTGAENPMVIFAVQAEAPVEVDAGALAGVTMPAKMNKMFVVTEASLFYFKAFFLHMGFEEDGTSLQVMMDNCIGKTFKGTVVHTPDRKDPSIMRTEIRETMLA